MKINRDIIRWLSMITVLLVILEIIFYSKINDTIIESILFNIVTGCIVSIIMSYINYKNELEKINEKLLKNVSDYYFGLQNILFYCKNIEKKNSDELFNILDRSITQISTENRIEFDSDNYSFIIRNSKLKKLDFNYRQLKQILAAQEFLIIIFETKTLMKDKKESVKKIHSIAKKYNKKIDLLMSEIEVCKINKTWKFYKESLNELIVKE